MKKILWLSDSPFTNTGYATISRNILNGLADEYECHFTAHNFLGQDLPPGIRFRDGFECKFWIHGNGREPYNHDILPGRLRKLQPDYFIVLLDTFMVYPWWMSMNFSPAKSTFYFPSDGEPHLPAGCEAVLQHMSRNVAMSKFAQAQAKQQGIETDYIPHACDHNLFRPYSPEEKDRVRRDMVVKSVDGQLVKGFLNNKFVVGTVARNQGRKMLDRTLKAFAMFCVDHPTAVLYMHCDPLDMSAVYDLRHHIKRLNIENRVCFSPISFFEDFPIQEMPKVYNSFDVFFLSTSGEGFGVPTIEAMSCELPCMVTNYTTTPELFELGGKPCGFGIPVVTDITGSWVVERAVMDVPEAAQLLKYLCENPAIRAEFGKLARQKVLREYTWDIAIKMWKDFLRRQG